MLSIGHKGIVCRHADTDLTGRQLLPNANAALNRRQPGHDQRRMRTFLALATVVTANALSMQSNAMLVALMLLLLTCRRLTAIFLRAVLRAPLRPNLLHPAPRRLRASRRPSHHTEHLYW